MNKQKQKKKRGPSQRKEKDLQRQRLLTLFPVKIDGKELFQVKAITSLFFYVRTLLFQGGAALPPANPAISEPVFFTLFNSMEDFSILTIPSPLSLFLYSKKSQINISSYHLRIIRKSSPFNKEKGKAMKPFLQLVLPFPLDRLEL